MIERLALDTNAVVDWFRAERAEPPALRTAGSLVLPVVGELYGGAFASARFQENRRLVENFVAQHSVEKPDEETAVIYGRLRGRARIANARHAKLDDLWIAALCLQHSLPLLTNDRGFDSVEGLTVIHW